ncbi:MAG: 50S ribosomal protein L5 [Chlamydiae bacterium]|nr:50S ribosomal protein L5 [Chlamydiota bacterium]
MSKLQKKYREEIKKSLQELFKYSNSMLIPELKKVVINMGIGEAARDKNALQDCVKELTMISGQKPIPMRAKKSVANFKLREGQAIGLKVTLRRKRMYDFVDRFCNIVSPRIRDFRGFSYKCDGRGNFSLGLEDQQVFPEINLDEVKRTQGMSMTFVTSARTDEECFQLLKALGIPFKEREGK